MRHMTSGVARLPLAAAVISIGVLVVSSSTPAARRVDRASVTAGVGQSSRTVQQRSGTSDPGARVVRFVFTGQDEALAQEIYAQLKVGADFTALARKYEVSQGQLPDFTDQYRVVKGTAVPEFDQAVFASASQTGRWLPPVKTVMYGWFGIEPLSPLPSSGEKPASAGKLGWPTLPSALVPLSAVANGCGGTGVSVYLTPEKWTFQSGVLLRRTHKVDFRPACLFHDAGYSGAKVADPQDGTVIDYFTWSRERVDAQLRTNARRLCGEAIPAHEAGIRAACYTTVDTAIGLIRKYGEKWYVRRPDLNGTWASVNGVKITITQGVGSPKGRDPRYVRGTWANGAVSGEFRGTLITENLSSEVIGYERTTASDTAKRITIGLKPDAPDTIVIASSVLSGSDNIVTLRRTRS